MYYGLLFKTIYGNVNSNFQCLLYLCLLLFFSLLVRPPMSQSLLIMGWYSSIPEHRLRLHLDSGPIFNLSLLRLGYNPVYLRLSRVWSIFFTPSPPRSTPPHWSHWIPVTPPPPSPPPIPCLTPMLPPLPAPLFPPPPCLLSPPPSPRFLSSPVPVSSRFPSALTIVGGPVSPPVAPSPRRGPESVSSQRIARSYSVLWFVI